MGWLDSLFGGGKKKKRRKSRAASPYLTPFTEAT